MLKYVLVKKWDQMVLGKRKGLHLAFLTCLNLVTMKFVLTEPIKKNRNKRIMGFYFNLNKCNPTNELMMSNASLYIM